MRLAVRPLALETVVVADAGGRVLGEPLRARIDSPRGDVAAMDGFALQDAAIQQGRRIFNVVGSSYAGDRPGPAIEETSAHRVMTGAIIPRLADRVIPYELVEERQGQLYLNDVVPDGRHVRARASDFRAGQTLLEAGTLLDPPRLLLASASDQPSVAVYKRPRVSVIASGDELAVAGEASSGHASIPDSLSDALLLFARQWGAEPGCKILVKDDEASLREAARRQITENDIIVLIGGAADGDRDFARSALPSLGLEIGFAGVDIKPGKPVWFGQLGATHILGLPGNPAAAMLVARLFLAPLICALNGRGFHNALKWHDARLSCTVPMAGSRETFLFGCRDGSNVQIIEPQSASAQLSLAAANVILRRQPNAMASARGTAVPILEL